MATFGKPKSFGDLKRQAKGFSELRRVLIVCEGSKTEPNYFRGLLKKLGLRAASVVVVGEECDSAPISVFQYAAKRFADDGSFDEVHCVFDRDRHQTFDEAVALIERHPSKNFKAVVSYPSFEYWVLLHFRYTRAPFIAQGLASPGDMVLKAVKEAWPGYAKGAEDAFQHLDADGKTSTAMLYAKRARTDAENTGALNPSTDIDKLVFHIEDLAASQLKPAVRKA